MQTLDALRATADYAAAEGEGLIRQGHSAQPVIATVSDVTLRAKEIQAELAVVMTLDAIYFGPKTRAAAKSVEAALNTTEPWWRVDESKTQALIDALGAELDLNLTGPLD